MTFRTNRDRDVVQLIGFDPVRVYGLYGHVRLGMGAEDEEVVVHDVHAYLTAPDGRPLAIVYEDGSPFDTYSRDTLEAGTKEGGE